MGEGEPIDYVCGLGFGFDEAVAREKRNDRAMETLGRALRTVGRRIRWMQTKKG